MCLFPMGGFSDSLNPPNEQSKTHVTRMKIIMFIALGLGIIKLIFGQFSGINELFSCCIIYCAYSKLDFCNCSIYIIFALFNIIINLSTIGKVFQNGLPFFTSGNSNYNFTLFLILFSIVFYFVALVVVFYAYREFKAILHEGAMPRAEEDDEQQMQNFGGGMFGGGNYGNNNAGNHENGLF